MKLFTVWPVIFLLLFAADCFAQALPDINYRDYGYHKQVKRLEQIYYGFDGDSIEKVEKVIRGFNVQGNIEHYETYNFLDGSWAKSSATYRRGLLYREVWQHSNAYLNRTYTYQYDKQDRIIKEHIRFKDGSRSYTRFQYKNNLLFETEADIDGTRSVSRRYYTRNGQLYKEMHWQKVPGEADILTNYFYVNEKEVLSYVEPQSYFYATAYIDDIGEIKFRLNEDSTIQDKLLQIFSGFGTGTLQDSLPFNLQTYTEKLLELYKNNKNKVIPYRMVLYARDDQKGMLAEAEVDIKNKSITSIGFFKIEYSDGAVTGATDYDGNMRTAFETRLRKIGLP